MYKNKNAFYVPYPFRMWAIVDHHNFLFFAELSNIFITPSIPCVPLGFRGIDKWHESTWWKGQSNIKMTRCAKTQYLFYTNSCFIHLTQHSLMGSKMLTIIINIIDVIKHCSNIHLQKLLGRLLAVSLCHVLQVKFSKFFYIMCLGDYRF